MMQKNVRLCSAELFDYKNVAHGKIEMPSAAKRDFSCDRAEILGIYGQNGSGKTTVIEALSLAKFLLSGEALPQDAADDIAKNADAAACALSFFIGDENEGVIAEYFFLMRRADSVEQRVYIAEEKLSYRAVTAGKASAAKLLLHYEADGKGRFLAPKYRYAAIVKNEEDAVELAVAKRLSVRGGTSFLFSADAYEFLKRASSEALPDGAILKMIMETLPRYAKEGFFVVDSNHSGTIAIGAVMPLALQFDGDEGTPEHMMLSLTEPSVQPLSVYDFVKKSVHALNHVLSVLIPDMQLYIKEYGGQVTADGRDGMRFEILSVRGETRIPLKCESEGIKKLISILNILIAMYNHPSVLVAVDEFDAGVYEYLLGEILRVLEENGRGQLLFTSHNLRPLEMIDRRALVFTTTNPENRYIRLAGVKGNLRDGYIRSIHVGGQKEELYGYANPLEIARAFRLAGKIHSESEETR
jgi:ABC-type ATPase involved in cell division